MIKSYSWILMLSLVTIPSSAQITKSNSTMHAFTLSESKELKVIPSATSSLSDFDFLEGKWNVHNRKLNERLSNNNSWSEFESVLQMRKNAMGNVENYYASFDGKPFEGMAVRLFNPTTRLWTIYWIDTGNVVMDQHPVTGSFENGLGKFYAKDVFKRKEILVLYQWDARDSEQPKWSQAYSIDQGNTWEWNWEMIFTKARN